MFLIFIFRTARIAPRVAAGGYKHDFQTDVGLYRKTYSSENIFDTRIESGGTVILGEEILLRVLIKEGDGSFLRNYKIYDNKIKNLKLLNLIPRIQI